MLQHMYVCVCECMYIPICVCQYMCVYILDDRASSYNTSSTCADQMDFNAYATPIHVYYTPYTI